MKVACVVFMNCTRYNKEEINVCVSSYGNSYSSGPPRFGGSRGGPPSGKKFGSPGDRLRKKHWNLDELPKFEKNFYQEHPDVAHRSSVQEPYLFFIHVHYKLDQWFIYLYTTHTYHFHMIVFF